MIESLRVPAFCPACGCLMKGKSTGSWYRHGCCINCEIWFLEGRPEKEKAWNMGWRPNPEEVKQMMEGMGLI